MKWIDRCEKNVAPEIRTDVYGWKNGLLNTLKLVRTRWGPTRIYENKARRENEEPL